MLLRIGLLVLIVLALARPRVLSEHFNLSTDRPIAAVLIFDTSPSMGYAVGDRTRLVISHRPATLRGVDRLIELADGRLIERPRAA